MFKVKVGELRNQLSAYLKRVRRGAEVIILDRDTPIGRLVPYEKGKEAPFEMLPPPKGFEGLARIQFEPCKYDLDIVELLLEDRSKR